jgi:DNA-binding GntR family transcriptional regulator
MSISIAPVKRESLVEIVLKAIERAILTGELKPGDRLVEARLASEAGISRGPVREAIRQLIGEGVLTNVPLHGTFVSTVNKRDIEEIYSLRATLEQFAVKEAMLHLKSADIAYLRDIVEQMRKVQLSAPVAQLIELDLCFHEQIYRLSHHQLLIQSLQHLRRKILMIQVMDKGYEMSRDTLADLHLIIVQAMEAGNPEAAADIIYEHVQEVGREFSGWFSQVSGINGNMSIVKQAKAIAN